MENKDQDRVQKTLDFIKKDRIIPEDPWFYSRLMHRIENEAGETHKPGLVRLAVLRLSPILAVIFIMVGIAGGIVLGKVINKPAVSNATTISVTQSEEDANTVFFTEINDSKYEQILLMK